MPGYGDNTELKDAGGVATGGQGGIDDIPAMLTEGEVVLNEEQQMAVGGEQPPAEGAEGEGMSTEEEDRLQAEASEGEDMEDTDLESDFDEEEEEE